MPLAPRSSITSAIICSFLYRRFPLVLGVASICGITGCHHPRTRDIPSIPRSFAAPSSVRFENATSAAGIDYRWVIAGKRPLTILQTIGNGCAFLDYDNDGNLDILLIGPTLTLYKGDGRGRFIDVT